MFRNPALTICRIRYAVILFSLTGLILFMGPGQPGSSLQAQEGSDVLFFKDFGDFDASVWEEASYLKAVTGKTFLGKPNHHLKSIDWKGDSVLRMTSIMRHHQRTGIGTARSFSLTQGRVVIDFRTMPLVDDEIPAANQRNIDGLIGLWLWNPRNDRQVNIRLWGGDLGRNRFTIIGSAFPEPDPARPTQTWEYDQAYRFIIESYEGRTHLALEHGSGETIVAHTYNFDFSALGDFRVALSQSMGTPWGDPGAEYYSDVAVDSIRVTKKE